MIKYYFLIIVIKLMKKHFVFFVFLLSSFSTYAEGISLSCPPEEPSCINCSEYQTLFPIEEFSTKTDSLDIEADKSELLEGKYLLSGNVEVNSEKLYLAADDVEVSSIDNSLLATGNVRFQDEAYLIAGDLLSATRDENENLIAKASNANYQDFGAGQGGANGYTESISKTSTSVLLINSTYSLCPVNKNDWLIDADQIELNLKKNRGVADNAIVKFYGVPIFYLPKYSWVLSGRGYGFLTPDYTTYKDTALLPDASGNTKKSSSVRIPYYFNLAPDRDLLIALNYMSSRRFIYEGKYRQLIAPKLSSDHEDSMWTIEGKYLPEDKVTSLKGG
jgi:LPS-assembly protein